MRISNRQSEGRVGFDRHNEERRAMFSDTFCSNTDESQHAIIRYITKEMLAVEIP